MYDLGVLVATLAAVMSYVTPEAMERAGCRALALDPNMADACLFLAITLALTGSPEEGLRYIRKGMRLNPHPSNFCYWGLGVCHMALEQFDEAIIAMRTAIEINPNFAPSQGMPGPLLHMAGCFEEAHAQAERFRAMAVPWRPARSLIRKYKPPFFERYLNAAIALDLAIGIPADDDELRGWLGSRPKAAIGQSDT